VLFWALDAQANLWAILAQAAQTDTCGSVTLLLKVRILGPLDSECLGAILGLVALGALVEGHPVPDLEARLRMWRSGERGEVLGLGLQDEGPTGAAEPVSLWGVGLIDNTLPLWWEEGEVVEDEEFVGGGAFSAIKAA
jgi:hypothetical protein